MSKTTQTSTTLLHSSPQAIMNSLISSAIICTSSLRQRVVLSTAIIWFCFIISCVHSFTTMNGSNNNTPFPRNLRRLFSPSSFEEMNKQGHQDEDNDTFTLHLSHEDKISTISIHKSETILNALERHRNNSGTLSSLPSLPQECRKGNCLTCAAKLISPPSDSTTSTLASMKKSIKTIDDGLSPYVQELVAKKGYVQTCCSYVVDDDVWLELDVSHDVWNFIWDYDHHNSHDDELIGKGERIRNEAMAKCIRMANEKNIKRWAEKTKRMLDQ